MAMSLLLIPLLAKLLRRRTTPHRASPRDRIGRPIAWLFHRRVFALVTIVVLLAAGYVAQRALSTGFLAAMDEGAFVIDFAMPPGTSLEETDRINAALDDVLRGLPEIVAFTRRTGTEMGPAIATVQNEGDIMVRLVPHGDRDSIDDVIDHVRDELHGKVPEARFEFVQVLSGRARGSRGQSRADRDPRPRRRRPCPRGLGRSGRRRRSSKRPELVDVFDGREGHTPILRSTVSPAQLARLGLDAATVGSDLEVALAGKEVARDPAPRARDRRAAALPRRHPLLGRGARAVADRVWPAGAAARSGDQRSTGRSRPPCCAATACAPR